MRAFLHTDLALTRGVLVDRSLGSRYVLTEDGVWILKLLAQESSIEALAEHIGRCKHISPAAARQAMYTLFGQLAVFGGITLQTERRSLTYVWLRLRWRQRRPGTISGYLHSIATAYGLAAVVCTVALLPLIWAAGGALSITWITLPLLVFGSCAVHEAGHALVARLMHVRLVFLSHIAYVAVLYVRPPHHRERIIALCGPLLAVIFCESMARLVPSLRILLLFVGLVQLMSVLPFCSDGKTIWRVHETTRADT